MDISALSEKESRQSSNCKENGKNDGAVKKDFLRTAARVEKRAEI